MLFVCHPKFCISIVFSLSWGHFNSQEKLKTMLMQKFGVTNKEHYGVLWYFWSGLLYTSVTLVFFAFLADASVTFVGEPHLTLAHSRARINVAKIIS